LEVYYPVKIPNLGGKIERERTKKGMSRSALAERAKITYPQIWGIETRDTSTDFFTIRRIELALGVELLNFEGIKQNFFRKLEEINANATEN